MSPRFLFLAVLLLVPCHVAAVEPVLLKEQGGQSNAPAFPCLLALNTNGNAANYRWYNLCSGYIWIFSGWVAGEGVGVRFGGPWEPQSDEINLCGATIKRVITYYRNVVPFYNQTVDVYVNIDDNGDGCPEGLLAADLDIDPGLRWNCTELPFTQFTDDVDGIVVRQVHDGGAAPTFATDGARSEACDPVGIPRSFYYGVNGSACIPWVGPTARADNFLTWLILDDYLPICDFPDTDCCLPDGSCIENVCACTCYRSGGVLVGNCSVCGVNATESRTWGGIKGLYR